MARKKRFCNKHGMSHYPPTGMKCPGPNFSKISLSGEITKHTEQQGGGIDVDVGLLQGSIPSIQKQQLIADRLAPAVEVSLRERVVEVEEELEENNDRLNQILGLLKKKDLLCVKSSEDEDAMKPERASRTKTKTKKRAPSPSLSSSSDESTCSMSPEKKKEKERSGQKVFT